VHNLGRIEVHFVRQWATGRTFAALETEIYILAAERFDLLPERHK
jgi:hypothetical protein